jgi:hypothetical protein
MIVVWSIDRQPSSPPVAEAELEAQVPPHTQDDDLTIKMAPREQFVQTQQPGHRTAFNSSLGQRIDKPENCTRAKLATSQWPPVARGGKVGTEELSPYAASLEITN